MPPDARQKLVKNLVARYREPQKPKTPFGKSGAAAGAYRIPGLGGYGREQNQRNFRRYFDQQDAYHDRHQSSRQPKFPRARTQTLPYQGTAKGWRGGGANTRPPKPRSRRV